MKHLSIQIAYREDAGVWNVNVQRETRTPSSGRSYGFPHDTKRLERNLDLIIGAAIEEFISDVDTARAHKERDEGYVNDGRHNTNA